MTHSLTCNAAGDEFASHFRRYIVQKLISRIDQVAGTKRRKTHNSSRQRVFTKVGDATKQFGRVAAVCCGYGNEATHLNNKQFSWAVLLVVNPPLIANSDSTSRIQPCVLPYVIRYFIICVYVLSINYMTLAVITMHVCVCLSLSSAACTQVNIAIS